MEGQIKDAENELKEFRRGKNIFELEGEAGGGLLSAKLSSFDAEKDAINRKIAYYNLLKNYLEKKLQIIQNFPRLQLQELMIRILLEMFQN